MDDGDALRERADQGTEQQQSGRWGVLLVLLCLASFKMNSIERVMDSAELHARALAHCDVAFGCCSQLAIRYAERMWDALSLANWPVLGTWAFCCCATLAFGVRVLWCRDLPWLLRWAALAYAMYTTVGTFYTRPTD